jgi:putative transposase
LNENWFISLKHIRDVIENWRIDYNEGRPHTSFRGLTPGEFVENTRDILTAVCL